MQSQLQDVTAAVKQVKALLETQKADRETWRQALYRLLTSATSLLFPDKRSSPVDQNKKDRPATSGAANGHKRPPLIS